MTNNEFEVEVDWAFVKDFEGSGTSQLVSQIRVRSYYDGWDRGPVITAYALWDTGATISSIDPEIVSMLGLEPVDRRITVTVHGKTELEVYLVSFELPNGMGINTTAVCAHLQDVDCLIGMDVIGYGDFAVSNYNGGTTLSFRIPSKGRIDFTER